jgi:hypothetical protein
MPHFIHFPVTIVPGVLKVDVSCQQGANPLWI